MQGNLGLLVHTAPKIKHFCFDADGVLKGNEVTIAELKVEGLPSGLVLYTHKDKRYAHWAPCDQHGKADTIKYLAGTIGEPTFQVADFNTLDGHSFERAVKHGYSVDIITGRSESHALVARMCKLPVKVHLGVKDKAKFISEDLGYDWEHVAFAGDEVQDRKALELSALSFAPANADERAKLAARFWTNRKSGEGVAQEIIKAVLGDKWDA